MYLIKSHLQIMGDKRSAKAAVIRAPYFAGKNRYRGSKPYRNPDSAQNLSETFSRLLNRDWACWIMFGCRTRAQIRCLTRLWCSQQLHSPSLWGAQLLSPILYNHLLAVVIERTLVIPTFAIRWT